VTGLGGGAGDDEELLSLGAGNPLPFPFEKSQVPFLVAGREVLLPALDKAEDQEGLRLRLRSVLRRIVERIDLLVTSKGSDRMAAVQIRLAGCTRPRLLHIVHRPPRANAKGRRPGRWWACWATPGKDLQTPAGVKAELRRLPDFELDDGQGFARFADAVSEAIP
jgi:hypothetical protein